VSGWAHTGAVAGPTLSLKISRVAHIEACSQIERLRGADETASKPLAKRVGSIDLQRTSSTWARSSIEDSGALRLGLGGLQ
jgi:hypothetical protein